MIEECVNDACEILRKIVSEKPNEIDPVLMLFVVGEDGSITSLLTVHPPKELMTTTGRAVRHVLDKQGKNLLVVVSVSEAWTKSLQSGSELVRKVKSGEVGVSDFDDKVEVVIVSALSHDNEQTARMYDIIRNEGGNVIGLEEKDKSEWGGFHLLTLEQFWIGYRAGLVKSESIPRLKH